MDFLKPILGDELFAQVSEKLKGNKDVKIANLATGEYIGKDKYDALKNDADAVKTQLTEANKQIESFKSLDVDGIKRAADDYKAKYETAQTEFEKKIAERDFSDKLKESLSEAGIVKKGDAMKAVMALINKDGLKLTDGKIIGLDEQLKGIKENNDFLFEAAQGTPPPPAFTNPNQPQGTPPQPGGMNFNFAGVRPNPNTQK